MSIKKISVYSHSISPSIDGVCRRYTGILHELVRQGYEVQLFTLEPEPRGLPEKSTSFVTLDHMIMPAYPGKHVARPTWANFYTVWQSLRDFRPHCIHITNDGFSHIFVACALALGIPIVGAYHTDILELLQKHGGTLFQQGCVYTKELTDSWILNSCATTSRSFQEKLAGNHIHTQHIIVTAVDSAVFSASRRSALLRNEMTFGDKKAFLCVYCGRISKEKKIDVIIEAVQQIDGCYLAIVGDGPSAAEYGKLHGKQNRVYCVPRFLEHSELAEVYASSDIHVSASEFETLGNTVLEAHACGIPVVVPRTQGFCDTVRHDVDGFLFEPGSSESARGYILRLKNDKALTQRMGALGLEQIRTNTIDRVVANMLQWYAVGIDNAHSRGFACKFGIGLLLTLLVPFGIFSLRCYDVLMNMIAWWTASGKKVD